MGRHRNVSLNLSTEEYNELQAAADAAGTSMSGLARQVVLDHITSPSYAPPASDTAAKKKGRPNKR